jgi:hypothetical protein
LTSSSEFAACVRRVACGDPAAIAGFQAAIETGVAFFVRRSVHSSVADKVIQHTIGIALGEVRAGRLVSAEAVISFVLKTLRDRCAGHSDPDREIKAPAQKLANLVNSLPTQEREALRCFYVDGEAPETICAALRLQPEELNELRLRVRTAGLPRKSARSSVRLLANAACG